MDKKAELKLIQALTEAKAPSGFEDETLAVMRESLSDICGFCENSSVASTSIAGRTAAISPF